MNITEAIEALSKLDGEIVPVMLDDSNFKYALTGIEFNGVDEVEIVFDSVEA